MSQPLVESLRHVRHTHYHLGHQEPLQSLEPTPTLQCPYDWQ